MTNSRALRCDGCGQLASPEHVARRLQRLEWTTRYRPIHIGTLFLGAASPRNDADFLYTGSADFSGEAALLLEAAGITSVGRSPEATLAEFQRGGFFLAHALECAVEDENQNPAVFRVALEQRIPSLVARIRRSLKPKRLVPISRLLEPILQAVKADDMGCAILLDDGKAFALDGDGAREVPARLREALAAAIPAR